MSQLRNPKHELIAQEIVAGKTPEQASEVAGFDTKASSFASNARKRAQRHGIPERIAELRQAKDIAGNTAADRAGLTAEYMLAKIKDASRFNVADYLAGNRRGYDIRNVPRDVLGRLSGIRFKEVGRGRSRRVVIEDVRPHELAPLFTLGARLQGLLNSDAPPVTVNQVVGITYDVADEPVDDIEKWAERYIPAG